MLLFLLENNKVLSYHGIQLLIPLKPQVANQKEHSLVYHYLINYAMLSKFYW